MLQSYLPVIVFAGLGLLVGGLLVAANSLLGPSRPNKVKSEPYECGLPSEVSKTFRFGVSFYMVAMLFILFDIEVVFLYPVGAILQASDSVFVLAEILIFVFLLFVALVYVWRRGSPRLEVDEDERREKIRANLPLDEPDANKALHVRQVRARDLLRGDIEGLDLEKVVEEAVLTTRLDKVLNWGRANAIFPATFGLACCAIEMMSVVSPRYDIARFGAEAMRASPRQADMLILSGRVSIKMAPVVRRLYDQMLEPKWVVSMGACSSSGGMFSNYAVVQGADKFLPVDIHVPGCPPRPEALLYGFNKLQRMIMGNPDIGWRTRYSAHGTEEWARDLGKVTDEARDAYAAARDIAEAAGPPVFGLARHARSTCPARRRSAPTSLPSPIATPVASSSRCPTLPA